jgi:hypothetical protein
VRPVDVSFQRLHQGAMLVDAHHEVRTGTPAAVLVEMPPSLDALHRCAAFMAGRRGEGNELRSIHGVALSGLCGGEEEPAARRARSTASASSWFMRPYFTRVVLDRISLLAGIFGTAGDLRNRPFA